MASAKAERPVGSHMFGPAKKEPAKALAGATKSPGVSKSAPKKAEQKPKEPKKKAKGGKSAAKN